MRPRTTLVVVVAVSLLLVPAEAWAGAAAADDRLQRVQPSTAFDATVVLNPDSLTEPARARSRSAPCPSQGTVAITISRGRRHSSAIFVSGPVGHSLQTAATASRARRHRSTRRRAAQDPDRQPVPRPAVDPARRAERSSSPRSG